MNNAFFSECKISQDYFHQIFFFFFVSKWNDQIFHKIIIIIQLQNNNSNLQPRLKKIFLLRQVIYILLSRFTFIMQWSKLQTIAKIYQFRWFLLWLKIFIPPIKIDIVFISTISDSRIFVRGKLWYIFID